MGYTEERRAVYPAQPKLDGPRRKKGRGGGAGKERKSRKRKKGKRERERERSKLWLAVVDRNEGEGEGDGREVEGRFGTAMNISLAHLFMQYFALAGLRRLPLSAGSVASSSLPPRRCSLR